MKTYIVLAISLVVLSGCASTSSMQKRLDNNFVYNCFMKLLDKNINPTEAERICTSSHRAEIEDRQLVAAQAITAAAVVKANQPPVPAPASLPMPKAP